MKKNVRKKLFAVIALSLSAFICAAPWLRRHSPFSGTAEGTDEPIDTGVLWEQAEVDKQAYLAAHPVVEKTGAEINEQDEAALLAASVAYAELSEYAQSLLYEVAYNGGYSDVSTLLEDYTYIAQYDRLCAVAEADLSTILRGCDTADMIAARDEIVRLLGEEYRYVGCVDDELRAENKAQAFDAVENYQAAIQNARLTQRTVYALLQEKERRIDSGEYTAWQQEQLVNYVENVVYGLWEMEYFSIDYAAEVESTYQDALSMLDAIKEWVNTSE